MALIPIHDETSGRLCGNVDLINNVFHAIDGNGQSHTITMSELGVQDVHTERALANYASGFKNEDGVADIAMPPVPAANASDKYWEWDPRDAYQPVDGTIVSPGGNFREISPRLSNNRFQTNEYALGAFIPTQLTANADAPLNVVLQHMRRVMSSLMINRELRVMAPMRLSTNYSGNRLITLAAGEKWNGGATSNPIKNIHQIQEASVRKLSGMIMDLTTWNAFQTNAQVQKYPMFKTNTPPLSGLTGDARASWAAMLQIPVPYVCEMRRYDIATGDYPYVWQNDVVFFHRPVSGGLPLDGQDIASGYTFRWSGGAVEGGTVEGGFQIRAFFNPYRGTKGGTQIIVVHNDAEQFISGLVGGLIVGAVQ